MPVRGLIPIPASKWFRTAGHVLWATIDKCISDNTPQMAAALSFYFLLSLGPAIWIVVAVSGAIAGPETIREEIGAWAFERMGPGAASILEQLASQTSQSSPMATVLGVITLLLGATLAFGTLYDSLNRIWGATQNPSSSVFRGFLKGFFTKRGLALLMVVIVGLLMLASVVLSAILRVIADLVPAELPAPHFLLQAANFALSMLLMVLMFGAIYRLLHQADISRESVWIGAVVTAVLFELGKLVIGQVLGAYVLTSLSGSAGSLAAVLLWVYYSSQILLFGAEFTEVISKYRSK